MIQMVNLGKELAILKAITALRQIRNENGCLTQPEDCDNCPIAVICRCIMELQDERLSK